MAGLFEKDIRLILKRKQALILFIVISVLVGYTNDGSFILAYLPLLMTLLLVGTIAYDDSDNGMGYLLSLPVTAKSYVAEKYILCIIGEVIAFILAGIIYVTAGMMHGAANSLTTDLFLIATYLPIISLIVVFTIPTQLKFGAEASRVVMLVVFGIVAVIGFIIAKFGNEEAIDAFFDRLMNLPGGIIAAVGLCVTILLFLISGLVSFKIMENKEY